MGKQNLRVSCPKGMLEFKFFSFRTLRRFFQLLTTKIDKSASWGESWCRSVTHCSAFSKTRLPQELWRVLSCELPAVFLHSPLEEKGPCPFYQFRWVLAKGRHLLQILLKALHWLLWIIAGANLGELGWFGQTSFQNKKNLTHYNMLT